VASHYDVAIIGAGDVGAAIARELARFELRLALIDSGDVGAGTSKANTAILHTGFDAKSGTLEARLVARGHELLLAYADQVGIPIERTGALLVAWSTEQRERFPEITANARANGYERIRELDPAELYRHEPNLGAGALGALEVPDEFIVCPFTPPLAFATQAVLAGVELRRWERVVGLDRGEPGWRIATERGTLSARWVVNTAGLHSDEVHRMAGLDGFTVTPRRGELIVYDKLARSLITHVVLPVPTATTKGVLVAPTVFGNVMVGPTADDIESKDDTASTSGGLSRLTDDARRILPELDAQEITATYVGLRAATEHADYQLEVDPELGYACAGGIRSTGLTASLAIAEWMRDRLADAGLELRERPEGLPEVRMPNIGEAAPRPYADAARIAEDSAYGEVLCFCERVTRGEIRDAAASPIPPADLDGLRRRTRVLMGRCQGFFCTANVSRTLAEGIETDPSALLATYYRHAEVSRHMGAAFRE
jgi:glycerol-3-phosphate dehydrogenase